MRVIIIYRKPVLKDIGQGRYLVNGVPCNSNHVLPEYRRQCMRSLLTQYAKDVDATVSALLNDDFLQAAKAIHTMELPK